MYDKKSVDNVIFNSFSSDMKKTWEINSNAKALSFIIFTGIAFLNDQFINLQGFKTCSTLYRYILIIEQLSRISRTSKFKSQSV